MKLFVFFVFLLVKVDGKPLKAVINATEAENELFWDIKTAENSTTNQEDDELSQNETNQLYDVEKSSNQSFLLAPRPPKVQQDENGVTFNADAKVNVTLTERRFQLTVYDPDVKEDNKQAATSFCFKAKRFVQSKENPQCLPNYCEIKIDYDILGSILTSIAIFGEKSVFLPNSSIKIEVSENKMYVIGKESEAVNVCELDDEQGYLPVQLVNKGDRHVHVNGVQIYNGTNGANILDIGSIAGITVGVVAIVGIGIGIFVIVYCCVCKKKPSKEEVKGVEVKTNAGNVKIDEKASKDGVVGSDEKTKMLVADSKTKNEVKGALDKLGQSENKNKADDKKIDGKPEEKEKLLDKIVSGSKEQPKKNNFLQKLLPSGKTKVVEDKNIPKIADSKPGPSIQDKMPMKDEHPSEISEIDEEKVLEIENEQEKMFEKSKNADFAEKQVEFLIARKKQKKIHVLNKKGLYSNSKLDRDMLSMIISRTHSVKSYSPQEWNFYYLNDMASDPINYLVSLKVISSNVGNIIHKHINLLSADEQDFSQTFIKQINFVTEIQKAKEKYTKILQSKGFKEGKLPTFSQVKYLDTRKVLSRMSALSIILGPTLDAFDFDFENPVIFLAPTSFLVLLLIRKDVLPIKWNEVFDVIRYRTSKVLLTYKVPHISEIFLYPYPTPAMAYVYFIVKQGSFKRVDWLDNVQENIVQNPNYMKIWDATVSKAKEASRNLVENVEEWEEKHGKDTVSKTSVEKNKKEKKTWSTQSEEESTLKDVEGTQNVSEEND